MEGLRELFPGRLGVKDNGARRHTEGLADGDALIARVRRTIPFGLRGL
jgi:hypothetical protein